MFLQRTSRASENPGACQVLPVSGKTGLSGRVSHQTGYKISVSGTQDKATNQQRIKLALFLRASLSSSSCPDGNGTLGLTARTAGKGEITYNKVNKFARVHRTRRGHVHLKYIGKGLNKC